MINLETKSVTATPKVVQQYPNYFRHQMEIAKPIEFESTFSQLGAGTFGDFKVGDTVYYWIDSSNPIPILRAIAKRNTERNTDEFYTKYEYIKTSNIVYPNFKLRVKK